MNIRSLLHKPRKEERGGTSLTVVVIALFLTLNLILVALGGTLGLYFYIADPMYYTLEGATDDFFARLNPQGEEVRFYFCQSEDELKENPVSGRLLDTLLQFEERYGFFEVDFLNIYYDYEILSGFSEQNDTAIDNQSVIMHCPATGGSIVRSIATFYIYNTEDKNDQSMVFNGEEIVATMLARIMTGERPKAYFTTGHGELSSTAMQNLLYSAGYDIVIADLTSYDIEEDCELIVISAPLYDFEEYASVDAKSESSRLREFVSDGGNLLVLRSAAVESLPRLDAFLASYGMAVEKGSTVRHEDMSVGANSSAILLEYDTSDAIAALRERAEQNADGRVVFGRSCAITLTPGEGYTAYPVLNSYDGASLYKNGERVSDGRYTVMAMSEVSTASGDTGKVILTGSSVLADGTILDMGSFGNEAMLYSLLEYVGGEPSPIGCGVVVLNTYPLTDLTKSTSDVFFGLLAFVLPLLSSAIGFIILRRRQKR